MTSTNLGIPPQTIEEIELCSLGLGLGPGKIGRKCHDCKGKGYLTYEIDPITCPDCLSSGKTPMSKRCAVCSGTGSYTQHRSEQIVQCRVCRGRGRYRPVNGGRDCIRCKGLGEIPADPPCYHRLCLTCEGRGEIEVFNSVFAKLRGQGAR